MENLEGGTEMDICVTKKLLDAIPFKAELKSEDETNPFYSWHANLIVINRKKTLVLMNDKVRYTVVLYGLMAKDMKRLDELIIKAIRETLQEEQFCEEVIEDYLREAGEVNFHKTKNRTLVARLNKSCENVLIYQDMLNPEEIIQASMVKRPNRTLVGAANMPYTIPHDEMYKELATPIDEDSALDDRVAVLHISLALENHSIWRRVLVPIDYTFYGLHRIIQILFDWNEEHLHEFYVYDENDYSSPSRSSKPILNIMMDEVEDMVRLDLEAKLESEVGLSDILKNKQYIKYIYDFGDDWIHDIKVEEITTDYSIQWPVCIAGEGTAPQENCGGEPGFEEFLRIMNDPEDEQYETMQQWLDIVPYHEFNMQTVNEKLED